MQVIKVDAYGDFDMEYTATIMYSETETKASVRAIANEVSEMCADDRDPDEAIKYLKSQGFKTLNTVSCTVGGNT